MSKKYAYSFSEGKGVGREILGGKGSNLAIMVGLGLPIPPGFIVTTETCDIYYKNNKQYPKEVLDQVEEQLQKLEKDMGKKLGDKEDPLLVSVRSGAAVSMPGMMDTVLNLGLNDESVQGLAKKTTNERFAWDSYRRFIQMFGDVVMDVEHDKFEDAFTEAKKSKGVETDTELDTEDLKKVVEKYKELIKKSTGKLFPNDPRKQLQMSIDAVFGSWNNDRAKAYRRIHYIKGLIGTAVNVQVMVFGNMSENSGTGVCFTRNPSTGENKFYGEYLVNAQGEDVVAGTRTPQEISKLKEIMPKAYDEIVDIYKKLENHYKEMQDMEFTIQEGTLYILQTRTGKRTATAAVKIAVDMVREGLIDEKTAVMRIDPYQLDQLLHKQLDPVAKNDALLLAKGLPASPGAAFGEVVFTAQKARDWAEEGKKVILVRTETSPEDIEGMNAAQGILTSRGGMTSHAAVVARGMGKCCVAGASGLSVNVERGFFLAKSIEIKEGDIITLDGSTGEIFKDRLRVVDPELSGDFGKLMEYAAKYKKLKVKTNADTPHDCKLALGFGAEGIGLARTEHMFFDGERIKAVREMILSENIEGRKKALAKIMPMQKEDFKGIFKAMDGLPVIIRLLDPPLHEFLPKEEEDIKAMAAEMDETVTKINEIISDLHEFNPMLGFRGCRLGVKYPEIPEMQTNAILEAAMECKKEGIKAIPWIEVPLVGINKEFHFIRDVILKVASEKNLVRGKDFLLGTMIEVPRAALTADEFAKDVDFMSFGTNDLTQMTCGFSRDDAGKFLKKYVAFGIYEKDPFQTIDQEGVGKIMEICVEKARKVNPSIELGICGEHGGDPDSVKFCHKIGLNDVSCSPFRIPIAILAAAQAAIEDLK